MHCAAHPMGETGRGYSDQEEGSHLNTELGLILFTSSKGKPFKPPRPPSPPSELASWKFVIVSLKDVFKMKTLKHTYWKLVVSVLHVFHLPTMVEITMSE